MKKITFQGRSCDHPLDRQLKPSRPWSWWVVEKRNGSDVMEEVDCITFLGCKSFKQNRFRYINVKHNERVENYNDGRKNKKSDVKFGNLD